MKTIVIAPNCFRGSATAAELASSISTVVSTALPESEIINIPLADGGDGTLSVIKSTRGGRNKTTFASTPSGVRRKTEWLTFDQSTAVIETADICGFRDRNSKEVNPLLASSKGVGEVIAAAVRKGAKTLIVGLGGTSVADGGAGALHALGVRFYTATGTCVEPSLATLCSVTQVDLTPARRFLQQTELQLLSDVNTPLSQAVEMFGQQKGLLVREQAVALQALRHLSQLLGANKAGSGHEKLFNEAWFGAGGGIGFGLASIARTTAMSGANELIRLADPENKVLTADLTITGEGRVDRSTWHGKLPGTIAAERARTGKRTAVLAVNIDYTHPSSLIDYYPLGSERSDNSKMISGPALHEALNRGTLRLIKNLF
ncbi:glycerate kinase [Amycolatopsis sp. FBCC-B4732]|uniref:glycerate kinase n=1 Tax=Amycolatopsis sp. FBCC-B4732 TaxID=3079339 RepID=UPI001FF10A37|nr:glycerate kinase [Amycolatopsis sp. FBCC-B4732]UOX90409.1 glycerate kinase [Amycolatopsis sp. FBCC-B4732]